MRKGLPKDLAFIVQAQLEMALETEELQLDQEILLKGVNAVFNDPNKGQYWIVEENESPIGMCLTVPEWSDWRNGTVVWIHSVYTVPSARGRGVYKLLYSTLKKTIQETDGLRGLRLYVDKRNVAAQGVYDRLGMRADHYNLYEWMK